MKQSDQVRVVAGKYELENMLGQGGMGEVWVAKELATGRKLALKLLKSAAADSKENRARFEREARIAKTLISPHIAQVTDSGVDEDGNPFMALELLHGEDLQKRIKTEKMLPLAQVVRLAIQVGRALHVAHAAGLVHRDLKPGNIFLARQGDEEIAKVLDFGIAKTGELDNTQYTAAGAMLGTASYMSPEQIRSAKTVDHRADLWAFAVVLFRALTGELPFSLSGFELFLALAQDPIPTPIKVTSLVPELPAPLNVFFERAFLRDKEQRYPNASAMVVGFCRAAGVTVPADILYAADAPMPAAPVSGPHSGAPQSGPRSSHVPVPPAASPAPAPAVAHEPVGLAGTMMLDASDIEPVEPVAPGLDPDEPDNAATLFYQPAPQGLPPGPPAPQPPHGPPAPQGPLSAPIESNTPPGGGFPGGPSRPAAFTYPLEAARGAAADLQATPGPSQRDIPTVMNNPLLQQASQAAQSGGWQRATAPEVPSGPGKSHRAARLWMVVMIGLVLALGAGAVVFLLMSGE